LPKLAKPALDQKTLPNCPFGALFKTLIGLQPNRISREQLLYM
jgi:hypothetical protein